MANWFARFIDRAKRFFDPQRVREEFRPLTAAERKQFSVARSYVPKTLKKLTPKNIGKRISVRKYQEAQLGGTKIETRAEQYRAGTRPKLTIQSRTKYPRRLKKGNYTYENVPWGEIPNYFERVHGRRAQLIAIGETKKEYKGGIRTVAISTNGDFEEIYHRMNSAHGYRGFSKTNPPTSGTIKIWPRRR